MRRPQKHLTCWLLLKRTVNKLDSWSEKLAESVSPEELIPPKIP